MCVYVCVCVLPDKCVMVQHLIVGATWAHHAPPGNFEITMHFAAFKAQVCVNCVCYRRLSACKITFESEILICNIEEQIKIPPIKIWISRNDSQLFALPYVMIYENRLVARM